MPVHIRAERGNVDGRYSRDDPVIRAEVSPHKSRTSSSEASKRRLLKKVKADPRNLHLLIDLRAALDYLGTSVLTLRLRVRPE